LPKVQNDYKETKIKLSLPQAAEKIKKWCAYQERSHFETTQKLFEFGLSSADVNCLLAELVTENFLNEERFARAFARGKFRIKKWGRSKIKNELKQRKVSDYCIKKALTEIDAGEYDQTLYKLIENKLKTVKEKNEYKRYYKVYSYALSRGFEPDLINDCIKTQITNEY
jgi:regulatory protein